MTLAERINQSESRIFKVVWPNNINHHDTLFGGTAMSTMDEVSFITATRFCRKRLVTVSSDKIDFTVPIPAGSIIEVLARVHQVGRTSMKVKVDIYLEQMYAEGRQLAVTGIFSFVALDEDKKPVPILDGIELDD